MPKGRKKAGKKRVLKTTKEKKKKRAKKSAERHASSAPDVVGQKGAGDKKTEKAIDQLAPGRGPPGANLQQQQPQRPSRAATGWGHPSRRLLPKRAVSRLWISEAQAPMQACPRQ
jgi:hypothetical protein